MFAKILVGTSASSGSGPALQAAAELASSHHAELVILQFEEAVDARRVFDPDGVPEPHNPLAPLRRRYPGLSVRSQRARGSAVRTVCALAESERPDLIVVDQGRRPGGVTLLSRRASQALVERAPCPVLLVAS